MHILTLVSGETDDSDASR